jgi:hypothetical protein
LRGVEVGVEVGLGQGEMIGQNGAA